MAPAEKPETNFSSTGNRATVNRSDSSTAQADLPLVATKPQVAAVLQCSSKHVEHLVARGLLRPVRLGRAVRFRRESVLRALERLEG